MKQYTHFSQEEREIIEDRIREGIKSYSIAKELGRSPSSITREIARNSTVFPKANNALKEKQKEDYIYRSGRANDKYLQRKKLLGWSPPLKNIRVKNYVIEKLTSKEKWSPDIISGMLKMEFPDDSIMRVSHECIYQFIYSLEGRKLGLKEYLLRAHRTRRKHTGRKTNRTLIPNRKDISERNPDIEKREEIGHWEGDSIVGIGKGSALHTQVERKSRFIMARKLNRKTAENTCLAATSLFKDLPTELRKTLTLDNGSEFTKHEQITRNLQMTVYFAKPYHSWERGSNENGNGMIRRYFPKGTNFDHISEERIQEVIQLINNRPRKILGYRSAAQVFQEHLFLYIYQ